MFCNQCEQTAQGTACTKIGLCAKTPEVSAIQDLLTYAVRGLAGVALEARKAGVTLGRADRLTAESLFSTLTNVNFDGDRLAELIREAVEAREELRAQAKAVGTLIEVADPAASFVPAADLAGLIRQGEEVRLPIDWAAAPEVQSLQEIALYGLRGVSAYAYHAAILGKEDGAIYAGIQEIIAAIADKSLGLNEWIGLGLKVGEVNLKAMELLDGANTGRYGHPAPTSVPLGPRVGKAILVSGHDLKDLEEVLKQTEGKGIYVYTHGEMLATHGYPELKKYNHFHGHYGTGWQNQKKEFAAFPGAILMTTNCLMEPQQSYNENLFTTGPVGFPGTRHLQEDNFGPLVEKALELPGFPASEEKGQVLVGFARNTVLGVADKVIEGVKSGAIKHFFLVGGCDGAKAGRNYYTEFVEKTPADTVVLTLACGKFRFFDKQLGTIGGIPRLLDIGQCNDAYSAIQIAVALAGAFDCGVNDLPLSLVLSWYEQKAVAILLTLLHLGIKGIRLGPSLPAFIHPNVLNVLVENFGIRPITTPEEDLNAILAPPSAAA